MDTWEAACKVAREERALMKTYAAEQTADANRERERATEWEGIAAGRRAALDKTRRELEVMELCAKPGAPLPCGHAERFAVSLDDHDAKIICSRCRIARLEKTLRFIARVDKTPTYGYSGTNVDKDRHGQLPKKAGQRWKTPRELVRDLNLPAE